MKTLSLRVPDRLYARLAAAARRKGKTKSALVREILYRFLAREEYGARPGSCLDLAADLAGCVSGPKDLATNKRFMRGYGR
jgi:hypothetical protein